VSSQQHLQSFLGDGTGKFAAGKAFAVGQAPDWPVLADLDGDGLPDLYAPMNDDSTFYVMHGSGGGAFEATAIEPSCPSPSFPRVGDLDGDGVKDVVYTCEGTPGVEVRLSRGDKVKTLHVDDTTPTEELELADFTGDGLLDLVTIGRDEAFSPSHLRVHPGAGVGTFGATIAGLSGAHLGDPLTADLDSDGRPDLVGSYWTGHPPAQLAVYLPLLERCR
jgi:hypothetical protein